MDTITTTNIGRLRNAVQVAADLQLPETASIHVHHDGHVQVWPQSIEDRRRLFLSDVFRGVAWDARSGTRARWSTTRVRGHSVTVFSATETRR